jgi:hypothetical protein
MHLTAGGHRRDEVVMPDVLNAHFHRPFSLLRNNKNTYASCGNDQDAEECEFGFPGHDASPFIE